MHPAPSIIIFSTLSGAGFGLIALLGFGIGPDDPLFGLIACSLALLLVCTGLMASLWHLGNPQRAWRALTQWRSSWLSREGILAIATLAAFTLYTYLWCIGSGRIMPLGILAGALAIATVYATSMIYASLGTVPRWSKTPTPALFLACALAGGGLALAASSLPFAVSGLSISAASTAFLVLASGLTRYWTYRAHETALNADGSTPETATGLGAIGRVRLFEAPHTAPNYLMKEMVFRIGRKHAAKLRRIAIVCAFIFPVASLLCVNVAPAFWPLLLLAFPIHLIGVATSRWLFFAEAEHVVALYYGHR